MDVAVPLDQFIVAAIRYEPGSVFQVLEEVLGLDEDGMETTFRLLGGPGTLRIAISVHDSVFSLPFDEKLVPHAWLVVDPTEEGPEVTLRRVGSSGQTQRVQEALLIPPEQMGDGESYLATHVFVLQQGTWRALPGHND